MAIKQFAQTRWKIEPQRVTIYPYSIFNLLSIVLGIIFIIFIVLFGVIIYPDMVGALPAMIPMILLLLLITFLFWSMPRTFVVFDNQSQVMSKKLFGLMTITSVNFSDLEAISIVRNKIGGYNYRAFTKKDKYGKGIIVSAAYGKDDDSNAIALNQEAFSIIRQFLAPGQQTSSSVKTPITDFQFYDVNLPYYTIKHKSKIVGLLIGIGLIVFAVNEVFNKTITSGTMDTIFLVGGGLIGGAAILIGAFTKIVFDTTNQVLSKINPFGFGTQTYAIANFVNFQITRRTTNLIYAGTDINMYFKILGSDKQTAIKIRSFRSTKKIDQFLQETRHIMGLNN